MKQTNASLANFRKTSARARLRATTRERDGISDGIEVQEEELGSAIAQHLFRMRCECGRSWFELELPKLVKCPACSRLDLVHLTIQPA